MSETARATRGMVVAPHHLAAEAGLAVLREGGNAIEAMVAAAAAIAVVYPHMNGLGGDNFWLISRDGEPPLAIDACGAAAGLATCDFYRQVGHAGAIPSRGPLAALTVAGAVSGWQAALEVSAAWGGRMPVSRLLADAVHYARMGFPVTRTQAANTAAKRSEMTDVAGFADTFLADDRGPEVGERFRLPALSATLEHLGRAGLDDFYRGDLARSMACDLSAAGSPLRLADFEAHRARRVEALCVALAAGRAYGMPPPTQGLSSMMILGLIDRLDLGPADGLAFVHGIVEATKQAFIIRDTYVTDPDHMTVDPAEFLSAAVLDRLVRNVSSERALAWPHVAKPGDTVWLGAIDGEGRAVSFIQSVYWEFGSGLVLPGSGITWQNRGTSFSLDARHLNALLPGRRPFHTIQPAMALLDDGRVMPWGTMGGEGQPQTKAAVFTRHVRFGQDLQTAVSAPRWLLGRTWGASVMNLRVEDRFDPAVIAGLRQAGHDVQVVGSYDEVMGHAGALVMHSAGNKSGTIEGAADPRGDGAAAGW